MKPMMFVALGVGLAACTEAADSAGDDSATTAPTGLTLRGRVLQGLSTMKTNDASFDIVIFWVRSGPQYATMKVASVDGPLPVDFSGTLPDVPSDDQLNPIRDPKTGDVPDPGAAFGQGTFYVTAAGALEENPEGVKAFDVDLVLGMAQEAALYFSTVDLETTEGVGPYPLPFSARPLTAGYHLFIGPNEVDLSTSFDAYLGYIRD